MAKVMLMEDDSTMRSLLQTLLEMEGFEVALGSGNTDTLIDDLRRQKPDLILMDVHLAGEVNGIDLLKEIRSDEEIAHARVILISGMNYEQDALAAGADGFLQKPYMIDDLLNLVREVLPPEKKN